MRALLARGVRTVAHVRPDSPRLDEWRQRFEASGAALDSSPWRDADITHALFTLQPTHVFSLLGTTRARRRQSATRGHVESYEAIDFGLTAMLIRAAVASGSKPRFIYLSALGVREHATSPYLVARWRAESLLRASGLSYTIARPSFITGPGRDESRPLERMSAAVANALAAIARAAGAHRFAGSVHSLTGAELADGLVRHAFDAAAENAIIGTEEIQAATQA